MATWICCQLGRREEYVVPRALSAVGEDVLLFTEAWCPPKLPWVLLRGVGNLRARYHSALLDVPVISPTAEFLGRELLYSARRLRDWDRIIVRNEWFGRSAIAALRDWTNPLRTRHSEVIVFAYSYAALALFRFAKAQGWKTVLGQIDAGPRYESIIQGVAGQFPWLRDVREKAPGRYWRSWREECDLADTIVVNSHWTQECMIDLGIPKQKLSVIPLVVDRPRGESKARMFPLTFTQHRPLRVLFVGQVTLGKGIGALLEAAMTLQNDPIEFRVVGPLRIEIPPPYFRLSNIRWIGVLPHSQIGDCYDDADLLLFPSFCDGFGLVQIEAQAHGIPVIASRFCGDVVTHGQNGLLLNAVTGSEIVGALKGILAHPLDLERYSRNSSKVRFDIADLGCAMQAVGEKLLHGECIESA